MKVFEICGESYVLADDAKAEIEKLKDQIQNLRKQRDRAVADCAMLEADKIGLIKACDQRAAHEYKLMGENAALKAENERLKASHARYETLRKLNVVQFQHLYTKALQSPIPFDELVDMLGETK